jgi:hypothetical protein
MMLDHPYHPCAPQVQALLQAGLATRDRHRTERVSDQGLAVARGHYVNRLGRLRAPRPSSSTAFNQLRYTDPLNRDLPATSYQLPATGYQLPATGYRLPATGYQLPATSYRLPATSYRLPATSYQLPADEISSRGPL